MRIVIDMQGAQSDSRHRGIGRYTLSFVKALLEQGSKNQFFLVLNDDLPEAIEFIRNYYRNLIPQSQILVWSQPQPGAIRESKSGWRRRVSELIRESFILGLNPDIVHITSFFEGYVDSATIGLQQLQKNKVLVSASLYDLIPLVNSAEYLDSDPGFKKYYLTQIDQFKKANLFLGISKYTCEQAVDYLQLNQKSVVNVSAGVNSGFSSLEFMEGGDKNILNQFGIKKKFLLCVSGGDPRKNLIRLAEAYRALDHELRAEYDLVLVGPNISTETLQNKVNSDGLGLIHNLGQISDDDLKVLYRNCIVFVFPSLQEGFGLPPLEAMSCGAPVISSNATSLVEVVGLAEALFDASSVAAITMKIREVLTNTDLRSRLAKHGKYQASLFSWSKTGEKALEAMTELVDSQAKSMDLKKDKREVQDPKRICEKLISAISAIPRSVGKYNNNDLILCAKALADTFPNKYSLPRIFVDISELAQRDAKTGIQRVTRSILYELLLNPPDGYTIAPIYGTVENIGYKFANAFVSQILNNIESGDEDNFIDPQAGDIFLGLDLQHHTTRVQANYLQGMRRRGVLIYFLVYDLLPIQFPHFWLRLHNVDKVHEEWLKVVCQMDGAICISKSVADELTIWMEKTLKVSSHFRVTWFHLGADIEGSLPTAGLPDDAQNILENLVARKSFLMVGTIEPRKGYAQALDAFEQLWADGVDVNLIIIGKVGWAVDGLIKKIESHVELGSRLFCLEGVSDEYLGRIYQSSTCLLAASEGEGFGLPLIEAAQHGIPIIARDIPVFREVAGSSVHYFEGKDAESLKNSILDWLILFENQLQPSSSEMPWITWKQSTEQLLKTLEINPKQQ